MNWPSEEEMLSVIGSWRATPITIGEDAIWQLSKMLLDMVKAKNPESVIEWPEWANWIVLHREAWYYCNQKPVTGNRTFYLSGKAEQIFNYDIEKHLEKLVWRKPWQDCIIKKPGATE